MRAHCLTAVGDADAPAQLVVRTDKRSLVTLWYGVVQSPGSGSASVEKKKHWANILLGSNL